MQTNPAGGVFLTCHNNGVDAIASQETANNIRKKDATLDKVDKRSFHRMRAVLQNLLGGPVFTFCSAERFQDSPWFTGSFATKEKLLAHIIRNGGRVDEKWLNVPFSNGSETGMHGEDAQAEELQCVTTEEEFERTFGISISELNAQG